jgi:Protein of unknown function (DUF2829)
LHNANVGTSLPHFQIYFPGNLFFPEIFSFTNKFFNMEGANLNFGQAVEALKSDKAVQRAGWNDKGMFVYLNKGSDPTRYSRDERVDGIRGDLFELGDTGTTTRLPNLNMRNATGSTVNGWLASQTDILAEDWQIIG